MKYRLVESGDLCPGDQIAVKRLCNSLSSPLKQGCAAVVGDYYCHHGVHLGGCEVIHFYADDEKNEATIRKCRIENFPVGYDNKIYKVLHEDAVLTVDETLRKADEVLANRTEWPNYNLKSNNCETFATWLKTGRKCSAQAIKAERQFTGSLLVCIASIGIAVVVVIAIFWKMK